MESKDAVVLISSDNKTAMVDLVIQLIHCRLILAVFVISLYELHNCVF